MKLFQILFLLLMSFICDTSLKMLNVKINTYLLFLVIVVLLVIYLNIHNKHSIIMDEYINKTRRNKFNFTNVCREITLSEFANTFHSNNFLDLIIFSYSFILAMIFEFFSFHLLSYFCLFEVVFYMFNTYINFYEFIEFAETINNDNIDFSIMDEFENELTENDVDELMNDIFNDLVDIDEIDDKKDDSEHDDE